MTLDFLPGLKTAIGGVFLLISVYSPELVSADEQKTITDSIIQFVTLTTQVVGTVLVLYGMAMKGWRWFKERLA